MADEFVAADHMEDWSLQAIVRGQSGEFSKIVDADHDHKSFLEFSGIHQTFDQELFASFPEVFDIAVDSSDGLEDFYKPFYSLPEENCVVKFQEHGQEDDVELDKQNQNQESDQSSGNSGADRVVSPAAYTPKYKRRKNHHKRVVIQVSAEGLSSDKWAWRKYGQKPIKGSPYPRSYYRCSSSKGCLARKQVEQSCVDPGMFIITYTAEHSHSQPTRRNSLSGTVRQKFPSPKISPNRANNVKQEKLEEYSSTTRHSPKTLVHFSSTSQVDFPQAIKREDRDETQLLTGKDNDTCNDFEMPDMIFNDEFFSGLEDFDDFISEQPMSSYTSSTKISVRSCS